MNHADKLRKLRELVKLFNEGALSKFIAQRFKGERGHPYPCQDSEILVVFKSEAETPSAQTLKPAIIECYSDLGFSVTPSKEDGRDLFELTFRVEPDDVEVIHVVITTNYHFDQLHNALRITSNIII